MGKRKASSVDAAVFHHIFISCATWATLSARKGDAEECEALELIKKRVKQRVRDSVERGDPQPLSLEGAYNACKGTDEKMRAKRDAKNKKRRELRHAQKRFKAEALIPSSLSPSPPPTTPPPPASLPFQVENDLVAELDSVEQENKSLNNDVKVLTAQLKAARETAQADRETAQQLAVHYAKTSFCPRTTTSAPLIRRRPSDSGRPLYTGCILTASHDRSLRWRLIKWINCGTAADIYVGARVLPLSFNSPSSWTERLVAIKVTNESERAKLEVEASMQEKIYPSLLAKDSRPLSELLASDTGRPSRVDAAEQGESAPPFMVSPLLLCDVHQLFLWQKLSRRATWEVFLLMVRAIQRVHEAGVLHRDVKPNNFGLTWASSSSEASSPRTPALVAPPECSSPSSSSSYSSSPFSSPPSAELNCLAIDFGESQWVRVDGQLNCPRDFVGTTKYASIARHLKHGQGRADDLVMLLYVFLELLIPEGLPWRKAIDDWRAKCKQEDSHRAQRRGQTQEEEQEKRRKGHHQHRRSVRKMKESYRDHPPAHNVHGPIVQLIGDLEAVDASATPPYGRVEKVLRECESWEVKYVMSSSLGGDAPLAECVQQYLAEVEEERAGQAPLAR